MGKAKRVKPAAHPAQVLPEQPPRTGSLLTSLSLPEALYRRTSSVNRFYPARVLTMSALERHCLWLAVALFLQQRDRLVLEGFPTAADLAVLDSLMARIGASIGVPSGAAL